MNELVTLHDIFDGKILRVPDYQRGYAWGERQLRDFWDDIIQTPEGKIHYTGMVSLRELTSKEVEKWADERWSIGDGKYRAFYVVDGQQRLTTSVILLVSLLNRAKELKIKEIGNNSISDIEISFIKTSNEYGQVAYRFGYEIDNPSFEYLKNGIFKEDINVVPTNSLYTVKLANAKEFFDEKVKSVGAEELSDIFEKLTGKFQFVLQELSPDFDVNVAFETMNNRGLPLSTLELLKNRLIYLTTLYGTQELPADVAESLYRTEIGRSWNEVYKQLGSDANLKLDDDDYLRDHWVLYFGYSRSKDITFSSFLLQKHFIPSNVLTNGSNHISPSDILDYVRDLSKTVSVWCSVNDPESSSFTAKEKEWITNLKLLDFVYFKPLIVASFMDDRANEESRIALFKQIERYSFITYKMFGFSTQNGSSKYYNYANKIKLRTATVEEVALALYEETEDYKRRYSGAFKQNIEKLYSGDSFDGFYGWKGLKYLFYQYEKELSENKGISSLKPKEFFVVKEDDMYSVEHIFPQTHDSVYYWANNFRFFDNKQKRMLVQSLGNLLPVSVHVNIRVQNYEYSRKVHGVEGSSDRSGYLNGSFCERKVAEDYPNDWSHESIKNRGIELLEFLERRFNVEIGDKLEILHLDFLDDVSYDVPELSIFESVFASKNSRSDMKKAILNGFWKTLNSYLVSNDMEQYIHEKDNNTTKYWISVDHLNEIKDVYVCLALDEGSLVSSIIFGKDKIPTILENDKWSTPLLSDGYVVDQTHRIHNDDAISKSIPFDIGNHDNWSGVFGVMSQCILELARKIDFIYNEDELLEMIGKKTKKKKDWISEDTYLSGTGHDAMFPLYRELKQKILDSHTDCDLYWTENYACFKSKHAFVEIHVQKNSLKLQVAKPDFETPLRNAKSSDTWSLNLAVFISSSDEIHEALKMIEASYALKSK